MEPSDRQEQAMTAKAPSSGAAAAAASPARIMAGRVPKAVRYALLSILLLAPCYWQPRIQAGDLSSHIYNSWLAQLAESGRAEGLVVARQTTNILFDLMLSGLFRAFGPEAAQRISVSVAVLIFIWGAFAFAGAVAGRRPWNLLPAIAMLAYGWVYHMGFFNFYLAFGLCFWAMAVMWNPSRTRAAIAVVLLALAYAAHALPVVWCVCLMAYLACVRRATPRGRALATLAALTGMAVVRAATSLFLTTRWYPTQVTGITGADQVYVFDGKYFLVMTALLIAWGMVFLDLTHEWGPRRIISSTPFQLFIMSAGGVLILPTTVLIPGFLHTLTYIAERMSLGVGVCVCALLASARPRPLGRYAIMAVAAVFFVFLFRDERALNGFEDRLEGAVAQLAPGERVVNAVDDPGLRANAVAHMIDRVCLGRCFSFANYEPSTWQFRVRAVADSPVVVRTYKDSWALQNGNYLVRQSDLPISAVDLDRSGRMIIRELKAGARNGRTEYRVLSPPVPAS
jgi:hypothetical protein